MRSQLFNPLDRLLRAAARKKRRRVLLCWNRGLGDIPLGLYALVQRIRFHLPDAEITFLTRTDLAPLFAMIDGVRAIAIPSWKRGEPFSLEESLVEVGLILDEKTIILEKPDPTRWLKWQLGRLVPRLRWDPAWDALVDDFPVRPGAIGMHIDTETGQYYGYEKNWPQDRWEELIAEHDNVVLFGTKKEGRKWHDGVVDLRGETSLFAMLSLIKNRCATLIAPDSGILSVIYYVDADFPLRLISLWADPKQGVLRQGVDSPNPSLIHLPLIGENECLANLPLDAVRAILS